MFVTKQYYQYLVELTQRGILVFIISLLLSSCSEKYSNEPHPYFSEMLIPEDNPTLSESIELGKLLFYEKGLSVDNSISCATCHKPELAFSDNKPLSFGVDNAKGKRNSPTLTNVGYSTHLFKDGGVTRLETQAMTPIQNEHEMAFDLKEAAERLGRKSNYQELAQKAYNRPFSPYVIVRGLAAFQRTLISDNAPFDRYFYKGEKTALSDLQIKGMDLFFSHKTNCSQCHNGFNFTHFGFENNGLYQTYKDRGREMISLKASDRGKFKVPTLRNIELTAPYMHDGSLATLEEVIQHYNSGGKQAKNQSPHIRPLNLSENEQQALIAFLHSLTDSTFIHNPKFQ